MSRMQGFNPSAEVSAFVNVQARARGPQAQAADDGRRCYRITNAASPDEAELLLYNDIGGWFGTYADEFVEELNAISAPRLTVRLNSPGGSVFQGLAIASALRTHPADITVRVDGIAASIASVIALAGDRLVVMPGATLMIHEAAGEACGDSSVMAKMAEVLDTLSANIADMYAAKAGGTRDEWRQRMVDETWFLADEAVAAGLADEVGPSRAAGPEEPEMRQQFDLTAYGYTGPARPEAPQPTPPPVAQAEPQTDEPTLTADVRSLIGEEVAAQLRAAVTPAPEPEPVHEAVPEAPTAEVRGEHGPELLDLQPEPAAPAVDPWTAAVARLIQPARDPWAALVARFTPSTSADSSATQEA
ncbi:head maturation protease, ClpP-related [Streptomyces sp. NPDC127038]|uniref:head maturation protease, ClpP-related n=1 Tax=Streptomyces sp. NPDC127038 TaxID=3347114 RepID=UPI003654B930